MTREKSMRPWRTAAAAALLCLAAPLAGCAPEDAGSDVPAAPQTEPTDPAVEEECDCRRAVKTPLKTPLQPIERDSGY